MTEDYKEKLLKYLTGKITAESGQAEPQFIDNGMVNQNVWNYLKQNLSNTVNLEGFLSSDSHILFYGSYESSTDTYTGFIYITSNELEPLELITEFDSGTALRPIVTMNIDESGNFYGVDNKEKLYDSTVPNNYRFIMLNKIIKSGIVEQSFTVKLRQSYFFPSSVSPQNLDFGLNGFDKCQKNDFSSDYFFLCNNPTTSAVVSLTINVGESNTWKITTNTSLTISSMVSCLKVYDTNNNISLIIGGLKYGGGSQAYVEALYTYGDTPTFSTRLTINEPNELASLMAMVRTSVDTAYVAYSWETGGQTILTIYKVNYDTASFDSLYTFTNTYNYLGSAISFFAVGGLLFFKYGYYDSPTGSPATYPWVSKLGMIYNNEVFLQNLTTSPMGNIGVLNDLYITVTFNLVTIFSAMQGTITQKIQLIFNPNNYNGIPYEAPNSLIPDSSILLDNANNVIFARNLYNKTVLGATTTSTVQVPNTMLNDVTIGESDLISETNLTLTEDTTDITKNVYETLNINFANSVSMRNDNDPENTILNPAGAIRLNLSSSQNGDYENAQANKIKVNYTDGTNEVIELNTTIQVVEITPTEFQYDFDLQVDKNVANLQIISNDEATVYQTIDTLNLQAGKTYNILQTVEIQ